jgi:tRNA A-37 threonylcarbamoyl transferase component Bud32
MDIRLGNIISFFVRLFWDVYVKIKLSYTNEIYFLNKLNKNYKCECGLECNHFPKVIYDIYYLNTIIMTHNGLDCKYLNKFIMIPNYKKQIKCIINNLQNNNINQNDIVPKNVCVNSKGVISIIDYDLAKDSTSNPVDYSEVEQKIINIIENNKYLILLDNQIEQKEY